MREVVCLRVAWGKEYMGILHFLLSFALILKNTLKPCIPVLNMPESCSQKLPEHQYLK